MFVSNLEEYGHLLNGDNYNTDHLNNDMYMLFDNRLVSLTHTHHANSGADPAIFSSDFCMNVS